MVDEDDEDDEDQHAGDEGDVDEEAEKRKNFDRRRKESKGSSNDAASSEPDEEDDEREETAPAAKEERTKPVVTKSNAENEDPKYQSLSVQEAAGRASARPSRGMSRREKALQLQAARKEPGIAREDPVAAQPVVVAWRGAAASSTTTTRRESRSHDRSGITPTTTGSGRSTNTRRGTSRPRRHTPRAVSGYCEICTCRYDSRAEHFVSPRHLRAKERHFDEFDDWVSKTWGSRCLILGPPAASEDTEKKALAANLVPLSVWKSLGEDKPSDLTPRRAWEDIPLDGPDPLADFRDANDRTQSPSNGVKGEPLKQEATEPDPISASAGSPRRGRRRGGPVTAASVEEAAARETVRKDETAEYEYAWTEDRHRSDPSWLHEQAPSSPARPQQPVVEEPESLTRDEDEKEQESIAGGEDEKGQEPIASDADEKEQESIAGGEDEKEQEPISSGEDEKEQVPSASGQDKKKQQSSANGEDDEEPEPSTSDASVEEPVQYHRGSTTSFRYSNVMTRQQLAQLRMDPRQLNEIAGKFWGRGVPSTPQRASNNPQPLQQARGRAGTAAGTSGQRPKRPACRSSSSPSGGRGRSKNGQQRSDSTATVASAAASLEGASCPGDSPERRITRSQAKLRQESSESKHSGPSPAKRPRMASEAATLRSGQSSGASQQHRPVCRKCRATSRLTPESRRTTKRQRQESSPVAGRATKVRRLSQ